MSKHIKKIILLTAALAICGCHKEVTPKLAELSSFTQTVNIATIWSTRIGNGAGQENLKLPPALANGNVYVADHSGRIASINDATGKTNWQINAKTSVTSGLAADGNMLFVGNKSGQLLAYQQSDGQNKWLANMSNDILATPLATNNSVIARTESGQLGSFDAKTGANNWSFTQAQPALILRGSSSPKVSGGTLVDGFGDGQLIAFDVDSGHMLWKQTIAESTSSFAIERMTDIDADPVISNGVVYTVTYQGKVAAVSLRSGNILWSHDMSSYTGLAVDPERVYVSDDHDNLWALDRATGKVLWKQTALLYRGITAPAVLGGYVLVGDAQGYLHCLDGKTGNFAAREKIDGSSIIATPIVKDNAVYVVTRGGKLAKLRLSLRA